MVALVAMTSMASAEYVANDPVNHTDSTGRQMDVYALGVQRLNMLNNGATEAQANAMTNSYASGVRWGSAAYAAMIAPEIALGAGVNPGTVTLGATTTEFTALGAFGGEGPSATRLARFGPTNPGPLADDIAATFRSSSYTAETLSEPTTLYRVIGDNGNPTGSFWTRTEPSGPLQSVIDSAIDPNWRNPATQVIQARVPSGVTIYEGAAASQRGLVGGGNQIYIPQVQNSWIVPR